MGSEKFCLKWNDFESHLSRSLEEIRKENDFCDVTLLCEDTQIEAHKVILGACSTFFKNVLRLKLLRKNKTKGTKLFLTGEQTTIIRCSI